MKPNRDKSQKHTLQIWCALFNLTVFSAYFYAFMEWVFFATKPSSLSILPPLETGRVLVVTSGAIALLLVGALGILSLPVLLTGDSKWRARLLMLGNLVPTLMLTITALIMLDNFTYTVFHFGVVSSRGIWRALYTIGFGIALWQFFRYTNKTIQKRRKKAASFLALGLLVVSSGVLLVSRISLETKTMELSPNRSMSSRRLPNILILGSDGLTANYLSAYGSNEETTPFLEQILETSLVAENAFPNSSSTTGSTTSLLTGKAPAVTKVYRYPDTLNGQDSIEHLPGILKQYGYHTVEIGANYYVDASKVNLVNGFDIVNMGSENLRTQGALISVLGNTPSAFFMGEILGRVRERLLHIFWIQEMANPVTEVNNPKVGMTDEQRVEQILELLDESDQPVFIFTHMMSTHGPHFDSKKQVFSSNLSEDVEWNKARYKDAILTFDSYLEEIYTHLEQTGQLDNTILIVDTDHGYKYAVNHRIPLVIHFPQNEYAGRIKNNVQLMDIPVTLLDYLGITHPTWTTGFSLLEGEPPASREIISIVGGSPKKIKPPFYQIKIVQFIICHKYYQLNVQDDKWYSGNLIGHTAPCDNDQIPSDEEIHQRILAYLVHFGYDTSSLKDKLQETKNP